MLDLTFDPLFKAFMLSDNTKHYKAELFSLITGIPEELFLDAKYTSEELKINRENEKAFITDVIIKFNNIVVSLEMNRKKLIGTMEKNINYGAKLKGEELERGKNYDKSRKIIQISFNNFHISKDKSVVQKYILANINTKEILTENFIFYEIDLLNLKDRCYNEYVTRLENLLTIFVTKRLDILKGDRNMLDKNMEEAILEIERLKREKDIIGLYDKEKVEEKLRNTEIEHALEKGTKKGLKQGINQGIQEVAKNMLKNNMEIDDIAKMTGLTIQEIEKLKDF